MGQSDMGTKPRSNLGEPDSVELDVVLVSDVEVDVDVDAEPVVSLVVVDSVRSPGGPHAMPSATSTMSDVRFMAGCTLRCRLGPAEPYLARKMARTRSRVRPHTERRRARPDNTASSTPSRRKWARLRRRRKCCLGHSR